jgi:signal transduction histidine kinase
MQIQVQHYLQRARVAAQRDSVVFRAPVTPILERLIRVTAKLNPGMDVKFNNYMDDAIFAGEQEDLEEIVGNLMENAGKWGRQIIMLTLARVEQGFEISVEDDGPGLAAEQIQDALARGKRLDETKPGTGLGLSIVNDTVREYGGTLKLERSSLLGGLRARLILPTAAN